jgi:ubiquinone/menaquinone biosynthesis C-methylase UbiE
VGIYVEQILPRFIDLTLKGESIDRLRSRVTSDLEGDVLEVGFGSGRNLPHLPVGVTRLLAVEPSSVGRKLAAGRVVERGIPVDYIGLDGARLSAADQSVDHVLSTWTLCTIPEIDLALGEIRRVLRPGGALHFLEHGRSPDHAVQKWQDRVTPIQRRLFGGCHLNRPIRDLVTASGLVITTMDNFYLKGPKAMGFMYQGVAIKD